MALEQNSSRRVRLFSFKSIKLTSLLKYTFLLPAIIFVLLFMLYPILYNIIISFQDVTIMNINGVKNFVKFENYREVLSNSTFLIALKNTLIYTSVCIVFQFTIGFLLALFFNQDFPFRNFFRSITLLAWMTPLVISGTLFKWLFDLDYGIINYVLLEIGILNNPINWLGQESTSLLSVIITNIWIGIPFNMILLLAALQSLPQDVYEAARIDGSSKIRSFFSITLPLLRPQILVILVLGIIYTFKVLDRKSTRLNSSHV